MFKRTILAATLTFATAAASATGFGVNIGGNLTGYTSTAAGEVESSTSGGSMAQVTTYGPGAGVSYNANSGYGYAGASAEFGQHAVSVGTSGGSESFDIGGSFDAGNATAESAGGIASNYSAEVQGSFESFDAGVGFNIGAFAGFGTFGH